jgi:cobalt-zinc-cadmium efflux system membrane fusion protein
MALQEAQLRLLGAEQRLSNLGFPVHTETLRGLPPAEIARRIQFLGLPDNLVRTFDPNSTTNNLLPLTAPFDGVVVDREAVAGEVVESTKTLFVVADPRTLSLSLHVPQEEAGRIKRGDKIEFTPDGSAQTTRGEIAWISPAVDPKTRTVEVRSILDNKDGLLRAGAFGSGRIILREEPRAILVKNEAIHWDGSCHIVFVRDKNYFKEGAPKLYHVRSVRLGARDDDSTEIIAGVWPGELVATRNSVILRGQLLIGTIGGDD